MTADDASPNGTLTLVLGGSRSGKSGYAEGLFGATARYVATARFDSSDEEFAARIALHAARRPAGWTTVQNADLIELLAAPAGPTLVDDIGTWLTAEIDSADGWTSPAGTITPRTGALVEAARAYPDQLVLVTPEVGQGVVPDTRSGRLFRDEIGSLNQRLAQVSDEVFFVIAGLATRLK